MNERQSVSDVIDPRHRRIDGWICVSSKCIPTSFLFFVACLFQNNVLFCLGEVQRPPVWIYIELKPLEQIWMVWTAGIMATLRVLCVIVVTALLCSRSSGQYSSDQCNWKGRYVCIICYFNFHCLECWVDVMQRCALLDVCVAFVWH